MYDELEEYPSKTGPGVTWGICLRGDRFKTLKLRIFECSDIEQSAYQISDL